MINTRNGLTRILQLLGMIGSSHDGEALNAARLAHREAERLGGWEVVISSAHTRLSGANRAAGGGEGRKASNVSDLNAAYRNGFEAGVKSTQRVRRNNWRQWAQDLVNEEIDCLSDWEIKFFGDFAVGRYGVPTPKQMRIFEKVAQRLDLALPEEPNRSDDG